MLAGPPHQALTENEAPARPAMAAMPAFLKSLVMSNLPLALVRASTHGGRRSGIEGAVKQGSEPEGEQAARRTALRSQSVLSWAWLVLTGDRWELTAGSGEFAIPPDLFL